LSLQRLALIAAWFDLLVVACSVLRELTFLEAHAPMQCVIADRDMSCGLPTTQDLILTLGLTLHRVVSASDSVTIDDTVG
jgi:hypothetical protein